MVDFSYVYTLIKIATNNNIIQKTLKTLKYKFIIEYS